MRAEIKDNRIVISDNTKFKQIHQSFKSHRINIKKHFHSLVRAFDDIWW